MKRISVVGMLFAAVLLVSGCAHMPSAAWTTLIDGEKGMENLNRIGDANWRAEDGAIVADKGKGGHLASKNSYRNFELYIEFWADKWRKVMVRSL